MPPARLARMMKEVVLRGAAALFLFLGKKYLRAVLGLLLLLFLN